MARSYREPAFYTTSDVNPKAGKTATSRTLRARLKTIIRAIDSSDPIDDIDIFVDDPRDVNRGSAGTRDPDWGWLNFGDGRRMFRDRDDPMYQMLSRK